jgi:hypothetical protein
LKKCQGHQGQFFYYLKDKAEIGKKVSQCFAGMAKYFI